MNWHLDLHLLSSHLSPEFVYIFQSSLFELTLILPSLLFSTEIFQFVVCGLSLRGPQQMSIFTHFYDGVPLWCASPLCCSSSPIVLVSIEHQGEWLRLSNCANSRQKKRRLTRGWSLCKAGVAQGYITPMPGIATIAMAENHIKAKSIGRQCQAEHCNEQEELSQACPSPSFLLQLAQNHVTSCFCPQETVVPHWNPIIVDMPFPLLLINAGELCTLACMTRDVLQRLITTGGVPPPSCPPPRLPPPPSSPSNVSGRQ